MSMAIELLAIIISATALLVSVVAIGMVLGMKWSTHQVTWKELDPDKEFDKIEEESVEDEDAEILSKALELQKKKKKQEDPLDAIAETSNF